MANPNPPIWDARLQFEQYVYDYMKKSGRTEAAEIFRREANLPVDPQVPPEIDVPDGFLHEWWLTVYDHFEAWDIKDHQRHEGFSAEDILMMNMRNQIDPVLSKQQEQNEQSIRELNINIPFGMTIARASAPSSSTRRSSAVSINNRKGKNKILETDVNFQALAMPSGNLGVRDTQALNPSQVPKTGKATSSKGGRRKKGPVPPTDGRSNDKPGANNNRTEASPEILKDMVVANLSFSNVKGKKAARGGSSSKKDKAAELSSSRAKGKGDEPQDSSCKGSVVKQASSGAKETIDGEGDGFRKSEECQPCQDDMKDLIPSRDILTKLMFPSGFILFVYSYIPLGNLINCGVYICLFHAVCLSTDFVHSPRYN